MDVMDAKTCELAAYLMFLFGGMAGGGFVYLLLVYLVRSKGGDRDG